MDSGTDLSHKDLVSKAWNNTREKAGSKVDLDQDGLPGDVNGWDFTANSAKVFDDRYNNLITDDVKTFFLNYSKYELGQLNAASPEVAWLNDHQKDKVLMNKVDFVGEYIHGTHVAGISALNNPKVKIISMKMIPTVYHEISNAPASDPVKAPQGLPGFPGGPAWPTKTVDQFQAEMVESASQQINQMISLHSYVNFHKVDVVNQSFGIGFKDAIGIIKTGFNAELKRDPTNAEMSALLKAYFNQLFTDGPKMFAAAPNTLFAVAAGNDTSDNDIYPDYPADIQAENKIVVAATLGYSKLAGFSNFGAKTVDVAAPGVAITSTAPTNTYIALSGTSQATPFVTNVIAAIKDTNPALSARDIKSIVLSTVDVKPWLQGKVKTSGIVNKARALKAAELTKTQNIVIAISKARIAVADVTTTKSMIDEPTGLNFTLKPIRPSLLVKIPNE